MKNKKSNDFNLNFDRIRPQVQQNIHDEAPVQAPTTPKLGWRKVLFCVMCLLLVAVVSVGSTVGVMFGFGYANAKGGDNEVVVGDPASGSDYPYRWTFNGLSLERMEQFDRYVCCAISIDAEQVLKSFLINEEDKDVVAHRIQHYEKAKPNSIKKCSVFLGEKDGDDYVMLKWGFPAVAGCEDCAGEFMFKSNLGYKLNDVIKAFEGLIGIELTKDYLCSLPNDDGSVNEYGIMICLQGGCFPHLVGVNAPKPDKYQRSKAISDAEPIYGGGSVTSSYLEVEFFFTIYNDQIYVVSRGLLERGYASFDESFILI